MMRAILLGSFLATSAPAWAEEAPWEPHAERFADAAACVTRLRELAVSMSREDFDVVRGPYDIAAGDTRFHTVKPEGNGHRIDEYRCLENRMSSRGWTHSMEDADEPFTVDSAARDAEWLKKDGPEQ